MAQALRSRDEGTLPYRWRPWRWQRAAQLATPLVALSLATCDDPLGPESRPSCELPAPTPAVTAYEGLHIDVLLAALEHAAGPMAAAIGSAELTESLTGMAGFVRELRAENAPINGCRAVVQALGVLDALSDDPATKPDRDAIQLILALAGSAFNAPSATQR